MRTNVGQTVLFHPGRDHSIGDKPLPAIVVEAHPSGLADLEIIVGPHRGLVFAMVLEITEGCEDGMGYSHLQVMEDTEGREAVRELTEIAQEIDPDYA